MCKNLYIILLFCLFIQACEEPVEIDVPNAEMQLVVQGEISPENGIVIDLTKSMSGINTADPEPVDKVNISISENGNTYINEQTSNINIQPLYADLTAGSNYGLIVDVPGFEKLYAHDVIPEKIPFSNFDVVFHHLPEVIYINQEENTQTVDYHVHIRFNEPREEKNYFHLIAKPFFILNGVETTLEGMHFRDNDNLLEIQDHFREGFIFSDKTNTSGTMRMEFFVRTTMELGADINAVSFEIETRHVSEAYYKYHSSVSTNTSASNPYADPSILESNIKNGLGAFVAYNPTIIRTR